MSVLDRDCAPGPFPASRRTQNLVTPSCLRGHRFLPCRMDDTQPIAMGDFLHVASSISEGQERLYQKVYPVDGGERIGRLAAAVEIGAEAYMIDADAAYNVVDVANQCVHWR